MAQQRGMKRSTKVEERKRKLDARAKSANLKKMIQPSGGEEQADLGESTSEEAKEESK